MGSRCRGSFVSSTRRSSRASDSVRNTQFFRNPIPPLSAQSFPRVNFRFASIPLLFQARWLAQTCPYHIACGSQWVSKDIDALSLCRLEWLQRMRLNLRYFSKYFCSEHRGVRSFIFIRVRAGVRVGVYL